MVSRQQCELGIADASQERAFLQATFQLASERTGQQVRLPKTRHSLSG